MAFYFEKPSGWTFKAGQSIDLTLIDPPETDAEGNTRAFSLAGAPHEDHLMVATRLRDSAFKRTLRTMSLGGSVKIAGPFGSMTLHNDASRTAIILTGGIGITPFRSMVLRAAHEKLPHRIILFSSNRRPEDAPFLSELQALEKENPNYRFIATMTNADRSSRPWSGETGFINKEMLLHHARSAVSPVYYVAGPPEMVTAMRRMLDELNVDDDNIRTEEFSGY
ncbi:oxidoreductase [candidate division GN15 bacterium]|uniref:Oxidoreductase n=1 Tax=candidate division GN15 bacterium TaxID=2072418 RepID=A0A855X325_9BACT|nr:MAG: oxidoreductase [candidate division GN15 bacterium]